MKVFLFPLILATALLSLAACQSSDQTSATASGSGAPSKVDTTFVNTADTLGPGEVTVSQLAVEKANDPAVRHLAQEIAADFTEADRSLAVMAQSNGLEPPSEMDGRHQIAYRQLQSLGGPAFDHAYVAGQLQDLTMAIEAFQAESDSGANLRLRNFAQQYLPVMQQHLAVAGKLANL